MWCRCNLYSHIVSDALFINLSGCSNLLTNCYSVDLVVREAVREKAGGQAGVVNHTELHLRDLLVNALYELKHKVDQFFFLKSLQVLVAD